MLISAQGAIWFPAPRTGFLAVILGGAKAIIAPAILPRAPCILFVEFVEPVNQNPDGFVVTRGSWHG
jgi:hypothetical protein